MEHPCPSAPAPRRPPDPRPRTPPPAAPAPSSASGGRRLNPHIGTTCSTYQWGARRLPAPPGRDRRRPSPAGCSTPCCSAADVLLLLAVKGARRLLHVRRGAQRSIRTAQSAHGCCTGSKGALTRAARDAAEPPGPLPFVLLLQNKVVHLVLPLLVPAHVQPMAPWLAFVLLLQNKAVYLVLPARGRARRRRRTRRCDASGLRGRFSRRRPGWPPVRRTWPGAAR